MPYRIVINETFDSYENAIKIIEDISKDLACGVTSSQKPSWALEEIMVLDDKSIMTFGRHKDSKLENVPASWLMWWYEENKNKVFMAPYYKALREYIVDNMDALNKELKTK